MLATVGSPLSCLCQPGWQGAPSPLPTSSCTHAPPLCPWRSSSSCQWTQPKAPPASLQPAPAHTLTDRHHLLASPCLSQHLPSQTRPPGPGVGKAPYWKGREVRDSRTPHPWSPQLASSAGGQNTPVSKTSSPLSLPEGHAMPSLSCVQMAWS